MKLRVGVFAEEVFDCIIISVEKKASKIIVVARWTLVFLVISGSTNCRARFQRIWGTWSTRG